eukprot:Tamp_16824.p1 GENE.Tamp_16824~~Tamp_16824.p1  ORF type:complete len:397 (+),score=69.57 Tamp_16824:1-1191(+)
MGTTTASGSPADMGEAITREQYKTADGKSASMYQSHVWRNWPMFKSFMGLFFCGSGIFVVGPAIFAAAVWQLPRVLSIPSLCLYFAHVLFGNAMHTGRLESHWWRKLDLHLAVMEYFRFRLLVEDDLSLHPDHTYIVGTHPHGVYALGQLPFMFTSKHNPLFRLFPFLANKVHGTGATVVYFVPLVREMFLLAGHLVVSKPTLQHWLRKKHSVGIVVGGEAEVLAARNNDDSLVLRGRKGFVRLALSHGADLLPTYCFHNTDVFSINTSLFQGVRAWLKRNLKVSIPIYYGWKGTPFPHPVPLCVAIGQPISVPQPREEGEAIDPNTEWVRGQNPPDHVVDEYFDKYVDALQRLFDNHKIAAGYTQERNLKILDAPEHIKKMKQLAENQEPKPKHQ